MELFRPEVAVEAFGPIMAGLLISARSTDIRVAQQLAALSSMPLLIAISVTSFQVTHAGLPFFLGAAVVVFALDGVGWALAVRAFSRERLLARYGG